MNCASCGHENLAAANFCSGCGVKLRTRCPQCALELPPTAKFCHECGTAVAAAPSTTEPPNLEAQFDAFQQSLPTAFREQLLARVEGENRLVTVLFADMSRSVETTRSLHPEDAAALVNR